MCFDELFQLIIAQVTESLGRDVKEDQLPEVLQGLQQW